MLRRADSSAEEVLLADLVIDASGRGSRTPTWLDSLGYARPDLEQVRIGLAYATRIYRLPTDALNGDLAILDAATPQLPRTGALLALEGDRWMVTLAGILGDHPPTDPEGFLDFARSLRFPTSTRRFATLNHWMIRSASAFRPAFDITTSDCRAFLRASS